MREHPARVPLGIIEAGAVRCRALARVAVRVIAGIAGGAEERGERVVEAGAAVLRRSTRIARADRRAIGVHEARHVRREDALASTPVDAGEAVELPARERGLVLRRGAGL